MGTSYWIKHDVNFPFRESGCIRKQATSFPQHFCGFAGSLLLWFHQWSTWSQGKLLQICLPCSSTLRQKTVAIRRLILLCSVIRHARNPFVAFPPTGEPTDERRKARREKLCFSWSHVIPQVCWPIPVRPRPRQPRIYICREFVLSEIKCQNMNCIMFDDENGL